MIRIVVPVFNKAKNIRSMFARLKKALSTTQQDYEVVFADDNSTVVGFNKSAGDISVMIDADLQYPPRRQ